MTCSACVGKIDINHKSPPSPQIHVCTSCDCSRRRSEVSSPADQLLLIDMALFMKSADHACRGGPLDSLFSGVPLVETRRNTDRSIFLRRAGRHSLRVRTLQAIRALPGFCVIHDSTANYLASAIGSAFKLLVSVVCHRPTAALIGNRALRDIPVVSSRRPSRMRV